MQRCRSLPISAGICWGFALALTLQATVVKAEPDPKPTTNRLAKETSPYLLLHAHNPVDWYPWGPEAFARAKAEKKPIFLSIGYSSCYWCHVMERECFMDPSIAAALNNHFVCIKVDREERPDVDQVYMAALQAFSSGGWPMSMFLTSDGKPFFGGTYFPPKDREGIRGFPTILKGVAEAWRDDRAQVEESADRLARFVKLSLSGMGVQKALAPSRQWIADGRAQLVDQFDPEYGGFGFNAENARRPKFPEPVNLVFLLDQHRRDKAQSKETSDPKSVPLAMVLKTMDHMARGGIRDHLAGGYHRYATSRYWIVPHFEKMLYDNAQLASAHLLAYEATKDVRWRKEAESTFAFVARTMTSPEGGFYSALDAETKGEEGKYYVWTREEVEQVLGAGPGLDAFMQVYGMKREPNFEKDRYVLLEPRSREEQATTLKDTPQGLETRLAPMRAKLLAARDLRPSPLRDDKILTSWNGLMIAAYADGFRVLKDSKYREAAEKAADFLLARLRTPDGRLLRTYRAGQAKLPAYLEDYAYLAEGLLRLHAATGDEKRLAQAKQLIDRMIADFEDTKQGGFFFTAADHEELLARPKDPVDGVVPSGNSVAILCLVRLAKATGETRYLDTAGRTLGAFGSRLSQSPGTIPMMLVGLAEYLDARDASGIKEPASDPNAVVSATGSIAPAGEAKPGAEFVGQLAINIKAGWHIYAHDPGVANLKPTNVRLAPDQAATLVQLDYPRGESRVLASSGAEKVTLYEGATKLPVRIKLDEKATKVPAQFVFQVDFQACNDRACLAPATLTVTVPTTKGQ
ncbi:DUF255 domain-containing protein [Singulisphaera sp. PoT]|uniref:DUF255 domain-containing protein n=1 Tax=Singulisphaera sp. PoT TaxID=3411797 RepID=UPI003BF60E3F